MDFVIQWLWYLVAFVAGSGVAWVIATISTKRSSEATDASGSYEVGG